MTPFDRFLAPLTSVPMSPLEILATGFGLWSVVCYVRESVWSWPTGLINVLLYIVLFWNVKLYADTGLQFVYVGLQAYGWWLWLHGGADQGRLAISRTSPRLWLILILVSAVAYLAMGAVLDRWTDTDVPWWDSLPAVTSLVAQWLLAKKKLENWWVWIGTDLIYIPLYLHKQLYLTAALYAVFLVLCLLGWRSWNRTYLARAAA